MNPINTYDKIKVAKRDLLKKIRGDKIMRTSEEMFALFHKVAALDERIRVMTLEGSRVNPSVTPDVWQDYDITFLVTDVKSFMESDAWLKIFGDIVFMQKPEAMELFAPDFPDGWFSYLMLFSDGVKIDLTLVPCTDVDEYFKQDPLIQVLLDKDGICPNSLRPSDERFWIQKPSAGFVGDCANEFFFSCTYVVKALLRDELLFASWTFEQILHVELLRMLEYLAGVQNGFPLNAGKHDKWLLRLLPDGICEKLLKTYRLESIEAAWDSLYAAMDLFGESMAEVCASLAYDCPDYVEDIKKYIETLKGMK